MSILNYFNRKRTEDSNSEASIQYISSIAASHTPTDALTSTLTWTTASLDPKTTLSKSPRQGSSTVVERRKIESMLSFTVTSTLNKTMTD